MSNPSKIQESKRNRYQMLLEAVFFKNFQEGTKEVVFERDDLVSAAKAVKVRLPKNLGDVVYSVRYRADLPQGIRKTAPEGLEWVIEGAGRARYAFRLTAFNRIAPNPNLATIKLPNSTPEIVLAYSLSDEQALLALVRYNRLIQRCA